ncbi:phosphoenolpyruvate-protein phosphotransferase [gamma proteobacterium HdN1]|nr:phosphoenolpyruvate-protein phosphotransferase [gamma proteobacterium HdN1]
MLETLRRIVQDVNAADDLRSALDVMVSSIREAVGTEVCSIYLLDRRVNRYILMATKGLNEDAVGRVSLAINEGLVGLVGTREEPINLDDAPSHPRFHFIAEVGEEPFHSFLGAPIIHHRRLLGVLVVQQRDRRCYDPNEEAFFVTMSAQLAAVIAHAEVTGTLSGLMGVRVGPTRIEGISGSNGIAMGTAYVIYPTADLRSLPDRPAKDISKEMLLLDDALDAVRADIRTLAEKALSHLPPEEQALFQVYERMLEESALAGEIRERVRAGNWVQGALREVVLRHVRAFEAMDDEYLRARASDVRDLGLRILRYLQIEKVSNGEVPARAVVIGEELAPTVFVDVPRERIVGIASLQGSSNSHMSIVARSMSIPTVVGIGDIPLSRVDGKEVIVDGYRGELIVSPTSEMRRHYLEIMEEERQVNRELDEVRHLPCVTPDGREIRLLVNTGLAVDVTMALERGAQGVGLYRTEIPFMVRDRFPTETEQMEIYRRQLEAFHPRSVVMRTLDVGSDKALPYFPIKEENPALGWRGIRITLDQPEIFLVQVRAMLWASEGLDNLRILLPMISSVSEIEDALHLIHRAYLEVLEEGAHIRMPDVGGMIEVPAAVYQVREFCRHVDFLSVGSNDLTQYMLAVDRNNRRVARLYQPFHPAVLRALHQIVQIAGEENTPVSLCGEMAGDPRAAVLLLGMGYSMLSMSATSLLRVKWVLRRIGFARAQEIFNDVMRMESAQAVRSHLDYILEKEGLGSYIRPMHSATGYIDKEEVPGVSVQPLPASTSAPLAPASGTLTAPSGVQVSRA